MERLDAAMMQGQNRETMLMVQIESRAAVANVEAIAGLDGVDIIFVGLADLCQDLGIPGDPEHAAAREALARVGDAVQAAGKVGAVTVTNPEHLTRYRELGFTMICCGVDGVVFHEALIRTIESFRRTDNT